MATDFQLQLKAQQRSAKPPPKTAIKKNYLCVTHDSDERDQRKRPTRSEDEESKGERENRSRFIIIPHT